MDESKSNIDMTMTMDYDDDWMQNDANRVAAESLHGALSSALMHSVVDSDSSAEHGTQGIAASTRGTLTSALAESVMSGTTGTAPRSLRPHHHANNSLIDPLVDTPIAQIQDTRPPMLVHSVGDSGDDNGDNTGARNQNDNVDQGNVHDL